MAVSDVRSSRPVPAGRSRAGAALAVLVIALAAACSGARAPRLIVNVRSYSVSKLPFIIAMDQGLFDKHGVNVELRVLDPDDPSVAMVKGDLWIRLWRRFISRGPGPEIEVDGDAPSIVELTQSVEVPPTVSIAGTDCVLRAHVIGRKGLARLEELKGKRIGITRLRATSGFHALALARRMGWDPRLDISLLEGGEDLAPLASGRVDAMIAYEQTYAEAMRDGWPVLADLRDWNEPIAGNSVHVAPEWLENPERREAARRFLMGVTEAIAVMHRQPQVALDVMARWYGLDDPAIARAYVSRGQWIDRAPYPCVDGIRRTMELYDSHEMRRHRPEDFYDRRLMDEIVASGFVDRLYR